ncbi:hypothetical protein NA57DRAFT_76118 [Rhizodiscina lignyota]|uniref:Uncharacterized protein n=1 Tax=Rhizodiscina lignyota TaxID=1504668 RepID=A0A9P4IF63_9PEZI|nr:hypothetical protein NA57DRAFT_76118 [Rhizodiscina lignyota]
MASKPRNRSTSSPLLPITLSLFLLPLSITILCLHLARETFARFIRTCIAYLRRMVAEPPTKPTKVVITGAGSPEGLAISRLLHDAGHIVIGADYERLPYTSAARASKAIDKFYALSREGSLVSAAANAAATELFTTSILHIIQHEQPNLWIPCASFPDETAVSKIKDKVEKESHCRVLHPTSATLRLLTDDEAFYDFVQNMDAGLLAPEVRLVFSRGAIHKALGPWPTKRRFVMQKQEPLTTEELSSSSPLSFRRHSRPASFASSASTLTVASDLALQAETVDEYTALDALILPSSSVHDTYNRIASIKISKAEPWTFQELVSGPQYLAHSLIVNNELCGMVISSLSSRQLEKTMSPDAALHARMSEFMDILVQHLPPQTSMHLNVRFVRSESSTTQGVEQKLYPVSCDFQPCTSGFLSGEKTKSWSPQRLAAIYTSTARSDSIKSAAAESHSDFRSAATIGTGIVPSSSSSLPPLYQSHAWRDDSDFLPRIGYYSLPPSIWHFFILPVVRFMLLQESMDDLLDAVSELFSRLAHEKEELFEWNDPWPWVWKWFVGFPLETLAGVHVRNDFDER